MGVNLSDRGHRVKLILTMPLAYDIEQASKFPHDQCRRHLIAHYPIIWSDPDLY